MGLASRLGRPRRDWETPNEHQRLLWGLLPTDPVYRIVQRFQRAHYGREEPGDQGLEDLREDAVRKLLAGVTTVDEVLRVTHAENSE